MALGHLPFTFWPLLGKQDHAVFKGTRLRRKIDPAIVAHYA